MRKVRRADELTAAGKTGQEIAAELGVSAATLYNSRRTYGGMDTDAAKELKELREQNARLKRLLPDESTENHCCTSLVSQALQRFCESKVGMAYIAPGTPRERRLRRIVQQPASEVVPQRQPLEHPVRGPCGHRRLQT